jgi:hypothetical protein
MFKRSRRLDVSAEDWYNGVSGKGANYAGYYKLGRERMEKERLSLVQLS